MTGSVSLEAFGWGGEEEYREEDVDRWIRRQVGKVRSESNARNAMVGEWSQPVKTDKVRKQSR